MSKNSHFEIHDTDSQILSLQDSISLPSEPPDIRNWFSSYEYESPELNTSDGFQDSDGSAENCLDEEKGVKSEGNQHLGNFDEGFVSSPRKSSDGVNINPAALVTGLSESLSFSSEPPDITNLFSSYVYESPLLDNTDFCTFSDHEEREDREDAMHFIDVEKSEELRLAGQNQIPNVLVKCTNMIKDAKLNSQLVCNDANNVDLKPLSSLPSRLISETADKSLNMINDKCNQGKSACELILEKGCYTDFTENKAPHEDVPEADCLRKSSERRSSGKENEETDLLENGFITIRKKSRANDENKTRHVQVNYGSLSNAVKPPLNAKKDAQRSRAVLSDMSNFHSINVMGSTGKWRCPQKNKPDLGPPLKQLRLDQWVRRI
ncbi:hypothetical protein ABFS82_01G103000 [Erythranthe guttata]|uniref:uncharacterized protein LOC105978066 n=1 Tax=Erythranthe guttata TaxID=4155 RepID=UPI00064D8760|nr:PREDICTED: uncharacterized protein LOC105978066 [Erythranthe guttata]|eukprot:XP_012858930.1 PREDICTED: uncharacterized protein LOC105978066 [Erythranthe guttata]